jgi:hypothetical protein
MKHNIARYIFEQGYADLSILGCSPTEAQKHAREVLIAIKKEDPTALFKTPSYEGFSSHWGRHVYAVRVVFGADPDKSAEVIRSLV